VASIGPGDGVVARRGPEIAGVKSHPERGVPPHDGLDHLLGVGIVRLAVVEGFAIVEGHAEMGLCNEERRLLNGAVAFCPDYDRSPPLVVPFGRLAQHPVAVGLLQP
jgi:hypothetical protein